MSPPIEASIRQLSQNSWLAGRMLVGPESAACPASAAVARWTCEDGRRFCIQPAPQNLLLEPNSQASCVPEYTAGDAAAIYQFADVVWKVKAWGPGMDIEAQVIAFVRQNFPEIPLPRAIHTWRDYSTNRSFLVMTRAPGTTLEKAWPTLTQDQRVSIGEEVADICVKLAQLKRDRLESSMGHGLVDRWIQPSTESKPHWKPVLFGPLNRDEAEEYFAPLPADVFVFAHADLGACNICVKGGKLSALLDWELAGFFPSWYVNYKARTAGIILDASADTDQLAWHKILRPALESRGFEMDFDAYEAWQGRVKHLYEKETAQ